MAGSPWTCSASHHVKLSLFLPMLTFLSKFLMGLFITFRSFPPRLSQSSLAWNQVFESSANSKQTFSKTKSQMVRNSLSWQDSGFSGKQRNPAEIHKNTKVWSNMSTVIIMHRAKAHSDLGAEAGRANEQVHFRPSHGNERAFSRKNSACVLNTLGKSLQRLKQDAKWRTRFISVKVTREEFICFWIRTSFNFLFAINMKHMQYIIIVYSF